MRVDRLDVATVAFGFRGAYDPCLQDAAHTHMAVPGKLHARVPIGCIHGPGKPTKQRRGKQGIELVPSIDRSSSGHSTIEDGSDPRYSISVILYIKTFVWDGCDSVTADPGSATVLEKLFVT
jgi:hypothetical protein